MSSDSLYNEMLSLVLGYVNVILCSLGQLQVLFGINVDRHSHRDIANDQSKETGE